MVVCSFFLLMPRFIDICSPKRTFYSVCRGFVVTKCKQRGENGQYMLYDIKKSFVGSKKMSKFATLS